MSIHLGQVSNEDATALPGEVDGDLAQVGDLQPKATLIRSGTNGTHGVVCSILKKSGIDTQTRQLAVSLF